MFGFFSNKKIEIFSPAEGKIIDITAVEDAVFSAKMLGDGFAVEPTADFLVAPCDGQVCMIAETGHAIALEKDGVEILLHVGIDTVDLKGQGFEVLVREGERVARGMKLLRFDRKFICEQGKKATTMLVLTNGEEKLKKIEKNLTSGEHPVLQAGIK